MSPAPDPAEAARIVREVVVPNLEASSAFRNRDGDNEQRMALVSAQLDSALAVLALAEPAAGAAQLRSAGLLLESTPGWGATRRQNSAKTFAGTRLGIARRGLADAVAVLARRADPQPEATPETTEPTSPAGRPAPTLFSGFGWLAVRYDALLDPATLAGAGVTWVAAVLSHGANPDGSHNNNSEDTANQAWLGAGKARPYRDAGIKVGGWGWHEVMPEIEAAIAATHTAGFGLDFWIANAEATWKPDDPRFVANAPERYAVALERELATRGVAGLPVGWSVLGAPPAQFVYGYDYGAFTRRGWHILPQAYPQQSPEYALDNVLEHALVRVGIRPEFVHPTIANYDPQISSAFKPTIAEWAAAIGLGRSRKVVGYSLWAHDWTPDDVRTLARL